MDSRDDRGICTKTPRVKEAPSLVTDGGCCFPNNFRCGHDTATAHITLDCGFGLYPKDCTWCAVIKSLLPFGDCSIRILAFESTRPAAHCPFTGFLLDTAWKYGSFRSLSAYNKISIGSDYRVETSDGRLLEAERLCSGSG